jgi:hypothetical protein
MTGAVTDTAADPDSADFVTIAEAARPRAAVDIHSDKE